MQLSYRGATYEAQPPRLQESSTEEIGIYRGALVRRKHFKINQPHYGAVQLTYRGAKYTHEV